jgi:hypothetical protein
MASASARLDDPAAHALDAIDAAPNARVLGLAVRVVLEISRARGSAAPNVTPLVTGGEALLSLPAPDHLRRLVGGTACDQPAGQILLREWLPVGVGDALADAARAFLRDHLMSNELATFRAQWRFGDNGMANNAGCGSGLEWVQCRYCGLADVESAARHVRTPKQQNLHAAHKRRYDEVVIADASAAESRRKASRALQKVLRNPGKQHSGNTHLAIQQVLAQAPVTYEPSVSTAASVAAGARGGDGSSSGGGDDSSSGGGGSCSGSGSSGGDSFNTVEERYRASLQQPRARTQQRRVTEVSDASGGEEVAAAEFKVPEPKTRGQKRKSEDAQEHREQWWLRGVAETDDEPQETHTGDSPRAMSTRSSLAVFNADEVVNMEKTTWPEQVTLHHVGMGAPAQLYSALDERYGKQPDGDFGPDGRYGKQPSKEARELLEQGMEAEEELGRDTVS